MTTKLIGLVIAFGIGTVVAVNIIRLFYHVTSEIQSAIGG